MRDFVVLWVSDLDKDRSKVVYIVTKSADNFVKPDGASVCGFSGKYFGIFFIISIITQCVWSAIEYFLKKCCNNLVRTF